MAYLIGYGRIKHVGSLGFDRHGEGLNLGLQREKKKKKE